MRLMANYIIFCGFLTISDINCFGVSVLSLFRGWMWYLITAFLIIIKRVQNQFCLFFFLSLNTLLYLEAASIYLYIYRRGFYIEPHFSEVPSIVSNFAVIFFIRDNTHIVSKVMYSITKLPKYKAATWPSG